MIFLSIDFDSFFLSRMDICLSMFMTRKEKLYEKWKSKQKDLWPGSLRFGKFCAWSRKQSDRKYTYISLFIENNVVSYRNAIF